MRIGHKYWLPKHVLIGGKKTNQMFKIQIVKKLCKKTVLIVMHHYETRRCDKVTLRLKKKTIRKHSVRILI